MYLFPSDFCSSSSHLLFFLSIDFVNWTIGAKRCTRISNLKDFYSSSQIACDRCVLAFVRVCTLSNNTDWDRGGGGGSIHHSSYSLLQTGSAAAAAAAVAVAAERESENNNNRPTLLLRVERKSTLFHARIVHFFTVFFFVLSVPTHTTTLPERRDCDCHRQPAVVVVFCFCFLFKKAAAVVLIIKFWFWQPEIKQKNF